MSGDILGGGVVVALAAGLWLVYLVPTMLRRREYLATERNAVRLQQTLRILAETAEAPAAARLEANARTVAAQEKILRQANARAEAEAEAEARADAEKRSVAERDARAEARLEWARQEEAVKASARAEELARLEAEARAAREARRLASIAAVATNADAARASLRRIRRYRAATSLALLAALVAVGLGVADLVMFGGWVLLAGGVAALAAGLLVQGRLARAARPRIAQAQRAAPVAVPTAQALYDDAEVARSHADAAPAAEVVAVPWTPQPLPKPMHLERGSVAATAMASRDAAAALRRAAARSELERRSAELDARVLRMPGRPALPTSHVAALGVDAGGLSAQERAFAEQLRAISARTRAADEQITEDLGVTAMVQASARERGRASLETVAAAASVSSRWAAMGVLDEVSGASMDLDAALQRRRKAG